MPPRRALPPPPRADDGSDEWGEDDDDGGGGRGGARGGAGAAVARRTVSRGIVKWTPAEDARLVELVQERARAGGGGGGGGGEAAEGSLRSDVWVGIAGLMGTARTAKQCRERYAQHLAPTVVKEEWSPSEEAFMFQLQACVGNAWVEISRSLPGRTDASIKNRYYSALRRVQRAFKLPDQKVAADVLAAYARSEMTPEEWDRVVRAISNMTRFLPGSSVEAVLQMRDLAAKARADAMAAGVAADEVAPGYNAADPSLRFVDSLLQSADAALVAANIASLAGSPAGSTAASPAGSASAAVGAAAAKSKGGGRAAAAMAGPRRGSGESEGDSLRTGSGGSSHVTAMSPGYRPAYATAAAAAGAGAGRRFSGDGGGGGDGDADMSGHGEGAAAVAASGGGLRTGSAVATAPSRRIPAGGAYGGVVSSLTQRLGSVSQSGHAITSASTRVEQWPAAAAAAAAVAAAHDTDSTVWSPLVPGSGVSRGRQPSPLQRALRLHEERRRSRSSVGSARSSHSSASFEDRLVALGREQAITPSEVTESDPAYPVAAAAASSIAHLSTGVGREATKYHAAAAAASRGHRPASTTSGSSGGSGRGHSGAATSPRDVPPISPRPSPRGPGLALPVGMGLSMADGTAPLPPLSARSRDLVAAGGIAVARAGQRVGGLASPLSPSGVGMGIGSGGPAFFGPSSPRTSGPTLSSVPSWQPMAGSAPHLPAPSIIPALLSNPGDNVDAPMMSDEPVPPPAHRGAAGGVVTGKGGGAPLSTAPDDDGDDGDDGDVVMMQPYSQPHRQGSRSPAVPTFAVSPLWGGKQHSSIPPPPIAAAGSTAAPPPSVATALQSQLAPAVPLAATSLATTPPATMLRGRPTGTPQATSPLAPTVAPAPLAHGTASSESSRGSRPRRASASARQSGSGGRHGSHPDDDADAASVDSRGTRASRASQISHSGRKRGRAESFGGDDYGAAGLSYEQYVGLGTEADAAAAAGAGPARRPGRGSASSLPSASSSPSTHDIGRTSSGGSGPPPGSRLAASRGSSEAIGGVRASSYEAMGFGSTILPFAHSPMVLTGDGSGDGDSSDSARLGGGGLEPEESPPRLDDDMGVAADVSDWDEDATGEPSPAWPAGGALAGEGRARNGSATSRRSVTGELEGTMEHLHLSPSAPRLALPVAGGGIVPDWKRARRGEGAAAAAAPAASAWQTTGDADAATGSGGTTSSWPAWAHRTGAGAHAAPASASKVHTAAVLAAAAAAASHSLGGVTALPLPLPAPQPQRSTGTAIAPASWPAATMPAAPAPHVRGPIVAPALLQLPSVRSADTGSTSRSGGSGGGTGFQAPATGRSQSSTARSDEAAAGAAAVGGSIPPESQVIDVKRGNIPFSSVWLGSRGDGAGGGGGSGAPGDRPSSAGSHRSAGAGASPAHSHHATSAGAGSTPPTTSSFDLSRQSHVVFPATHSPSASHLTIAAETRDPSVPPVAHSPRTQLPLTDDVSPPLAFDVTRAMGAPYLAPLSTLSRPVEGGILPGRGVAANADFTAGADTTTAAAEVAAFAANAWGSHDLASHAAAVPRLQSRLSRSHGSWRQMRPHDTARSAASTDSSLSDEGGTSYPQRLVGGAASTDTVFPLHGATLHGPEYGGALSPGLWPLPEESPADSGDGAATASDPSSRRQHRTIGGTAAMQLSETPDVTALAGRGLAPAAMRAGYLYDDGDGGVGSHYVDLGPEAALPRVPSASAASIGGWPHDGGLGRVGSSSGLSRISSFGAMSRVGSFAGMSRIGSFASGAGAVGAGTHDVYLADAPTSGARLGLARAASASRIGGGSGDGLHAAGSSHSLLSRKKSARIAAVMTALQQADSSLRSLPSPPHAPARGLPHGASHRSLGSGSSFASLLGPGGTLASRLGSGMDLSHLSGSFRLTNTSHLTGTSGSSDGSAADTPMAERGRSLSGATAPSARPSVAPPTLPLHPALGGGGGGSAVMSLRAPALPIALRPAAGGGGGGGTPSRGAPAPHERRGSGSGGGMGAYMGVDDDDDDDLSVARVVDTADDALY